MEGNTWILKGAPPKGGAVPKLAFQLIINSVYTMVHPYLLWGCLQGSSHNQQDGVEEAGGCIKQKAR